MCLPTLEDTISGKQIVASKEQVGNDQKWNQFGALSPFLFTIHNFCDYVIKEETSYFSFYKYDTGSHGAHWPGWRNWNY